MSSLAKETKGPYLEQEPAGGSHFHPSRLNRTSRPLHLLLLCLILLAGGYFRFHGITRYEPFIADEAAYHLEARFLYSLCTNALEVLKLKREERRTGENLVTREEVIRSFEEDLDGKRPWYARPLQIYLIASAMWIMGPDKVWLGGFVSALFGTLSILLVYLLGSRLFHARAGLISAALFSLSGFQVAYCHTGLTEQTALFFVLLAGLAHIQGFHSSQENRWKWLLITGLALGMCFVTHYRMLTFILAFFLWEAFFQPCTDTQGRWASGKKRFAAMGVLAAGITVPIVLTEIPYYLLTLAFHTFLKTTLPFQTYFEQLLVQGFVSFYTNLMSTQKAFSLSNLLTYPYLLWKLDGLVWPLVLSGALAAAVWRRTTADRWLLVLFLVPFLFCTLLQPRARYACGFLSVGTLLMASALTARLRQDRGRLRTEAIRWSRRLLVTALLLIGLFYAHRASQPRLSYGKAFAFLRTQESMKHVSTHPLVSQVYAGGGQVPDDWPPASEKALRNLYRQGYRFLLIDSLKDVASLVFQQLGVQENPEFLKRLTLLNRIEQDLQPVFVTENLHVIPIQNLFEVNHNFLQTLAYFEKMEEIPSIRTLRVYDLKDLLGDATIEEPQERRQ